jgi:PadR family transcriptional regulator, regulatory protein PadR
LTGWLAACKTIGVRPSGKEFEILRLLVERREMYGLELVKASNGSLKRGTIYVTLLRMAEKGYVASRTEEAEAGEKGPPRRIFSPTELGERVFRAQSLMDQVLAGATP